MSFAVGWKESFCKSCCLHLRNQKRIFVGNFATDFLSLAGWFTFSRCAFIFLYWMKKTMQRRMRAITTTPRATIIGVPD